MTEVSQREFFDARLSGVRELFDAKVEALEAKFAETISSMQKATDLQAIEYKRRLEELNHEKERIVAERANSVSREVWDRFQTEYNAWRQSYEVRQADGVSRRELDQRAKETDLRIETSGKDFTTYKEETRRVLDLAKGQSRGMMMAWGVMITVLTIAANIIVAYMKR